MPNTQKIYETSDLYLSAFLKAKGMRFLDKKREGNKFVFIFNDREDRKKLIEEFFNDGDVKITSFKNALQDLKTLVYNI
ncbi:MAG: hypothetical protein GY817_00720 [bacterium]|nr:hypothetical protein [bacterium]